MREGGREAGREGERGRGEEVNQWRPTGRQNNIVHGGEVLHNYFTKVSVNYGGQ